MDNSLDCLRLSAGAPLFFEGESAHVAYLIQRGEIEISVNRDGQTVVLAHRGAGEIIGEMALIDHGIRSASAIASTDCEMIVLTEQQIGHRIAQTDPILRMCLGVVIQRYRETLAIVQNGSSPKPLAQASQAPQGEDFRQAVQVLSLEREIQRAIRNNEFELYFQPIVDLETYDLAGFEALIRWHHPVRGLVPPVEFIPAAEASGLICGITQWCLREVGRTFPHILNRGKQRPLEVGAVGRPSLFITVNVSGHDILDTAFDETIRAILVDGGVAPENLKLEITESVLMKDPERAGRILQACRSQGMGIAVDDFGTGYSSLSYLSTLPITTLKIDRAFVRSIVEDGPSQKIVRTIRHLARELQIPVVAEGIETEAQAEALIAMNCEYGQGYLFGRPAPLGRTLELVTDWSPQRSLRLGQQDTAKLLCV